MNNRDAHFRAAPRLWADHIDALAAEVERNLDRKEKRGNTAAWRRVVTHCGRTHAAREGGACRHCEEIALVVLWCVTKQRKEDGENAPSVATVALDIAKELGAGKLLRTLLGLDRPPQKDALIHVGSSLLWMAAAVGMIQSIKGKNREVTRVQLTDSAAARYAEYLRRCIAAGLAREMFPLAEPPLKPVAPGTNWRGKIEPPPLPAKFAAALDHIRKTPWRVNKAIYQQMFSELPPDQLQLAYQDPQDTDWEASCEKRDLDAALEVAAAWLKYDFFLDTQCDYRGRIYHGGALRFNGADKALRPLLEFAEGQMVSDEGAKYLAAYVAARWGNTGDMDALERWTLEHDEMLLNVATDPDTHDDWKLLDRDDERKDKRWAALACADAWRRYRGGEPVHLPCSWDAVTSGLQVFALLMRDTDLGNRVGLMEGSVGTYYQDVADACDESRKAAKRVAIPLFYGSKVRTSAEALAKLDKRKDWWAYKDRAIRLRCAAEEQAESFVKVRDWLQQKVAPIFYKLGKEIRWTTEVGFEVVQDNHKLEGRRIQTPIHGGTDKIAVTLNEPMDGLDWRKQASSIVANVVHSLDASWLVATVNRGAANGITSWGTVHDCFAVHCNDVAKLNWANKMAILEVFAFDPLGKLHRQFELQTGRKIPTPPAHDLMFTHHWMQGERALEPG